MNLKFCCVEIILFGTDHVNKLVNMVKFPKIIRLGWLYDGIFKNWKSITYQFPQLYDYFLGDSYKERFTYIADRIGKNKRVLELGCGTGILTKFLDESNEYIGWDLNRDFVKYVQKRGHVGELKNVFDYKNYPDVDFIVLCDILHHVCPNHEELLKYTTRHAATIVAEPKATDASQMTMENAAMNIGLKFLSIIPEELMKLLDHFLLDNDGFNPYDNRMLWKYNDKELRDLYQKYNINDIKVIGHDYIGVGKKV